MFLIILLSCLGVSDDDGDIFNLDYTIHNTIDIYNNTFCNQTFVEKSLLYDCSCDHYNVCLNDYFNSRQFNMTGIDKLCNTNFTNKTNYNRCIVCNNNTSINFDIKIDDGLCNNDYSGFILFGFFLTLVVCCLGVGFIYRYHLDRRNKKNYIVFNN